MKVYPGGHMMCFSGDNRKQLKADVAKFMQAAISK